VDFEWLVGVFAEFDRKAREPAAYDADYLEGRLPELLEVNRRAIHMFEELRAVIVRPLATGETDTRARRRRSGAMPATLGS